jgi:ribulose-phosphate 3-epimerase
MTVKPGFGGQAFMPEVMPKVSELRAAFPGLDIQCDGGINATTAVAAVAAGANCLVAGSAVFSAPDAAAVISSLRQTLEARFGPM